jgi:hypothetical protein
MCATAPANTHVGGYRKRKFQLSHLHCAIVRIRELALEELQEWRQLSCTIAIGKQVDVQ